MPTSDPTSTWERPDTVARFAARDPDQRFLEILGGVSAPAEFRVLDLGCAAGRNTVVLAQRGCDFVALDGSRAMVARTRRRVAEILDAQEADRRVRRGRMDDLGELADASFDLVVALGVYHCASSAAEWQGALAESARVLAPGGRLLVSVFTPETDLDGTGTHPIPGEPHLYRGFSSERTFLVDAETLDREMATRGLVPITDTKTVRVELEKGRRVVANALYARRPQSPTDSVARGRSK